MRESISSRDEAPPRRRAREDLVRTFMRGRRMATAPVRAIKRPAAASKTAPVR